MLLQLVVCSAGPKRHQHDWAYQVHSNIEKQIKADFDEHVDQYLEIQDVAYQLLNDQEMVSAYNDYLKHSKLKTKRVKLNGNSMTHTQMKVVVADALTRKGVYATNTIMALAQNLLKFDCIVLTINTDNVFHDIDFDDVESLQQLIEQADLNLISCTATKLSPWQTEFGQHRCAVMLFTGQTDGGHYEAVKFNEQTSQASPAGQAGQASPASPASQPRQPRPGVYHIVGEIIDYLL